MKVLIVSDTHRKNENFLKAVKLQKPLDLVIHCGDVEGSEYLVEKAAGCPAKIVMGNNDFFSCLPREIEMQIGPYRALIVHGHQYNVSLGNERLREEAEARGFDIAIYGHTHRPVIQQEGGVTLLNPGSLSYPRQEGRRPSYLIMEVDERGEAHYTIHYI